MSDSKIIFAFAVSNTDKFEAKHFDDVDKYLIYEYCNESFNLRSHQINIYKNIDKKNKHGSEEKSNAIIKLLRKNHVQVLVSLQFGQNITMINKHFIPVAIHNNYSENIFQVLLKNMKWLIDEIKIAPSEYRLFSINTGVLKSSDNKK